ALPICQRLSDPPHQSHPPMRGTIDGPGEPSIISTSNAPASPEEPHNRSRSSSSNSNAPGLLPPNVIVLLPENWPDVSWPLIERGPRSEQHTSALQSREKLV